MNKGTPYCKQNVGKLFAFTLLKEVTLPENNTKAYYVIADTDNFKFTLPKEQFAHYNFKIGTQIHCKLDRINCSGQIFFEPENPYYKVNKTYSFDFMEQRSIKNYLGYNEQICIVRDVFGQKQNIYFSSQSINCEQTVNAHVLAIKKGKLFLVPENRATNYFFGCSNSFTINGMLKTERYGDVYLLTDSFGNKHALPKVNYTKYGFKEDDTFIGSIKGISSKGFLYIEPEHPKYKVGNVENFMIFDTLETAGEKYLFVEDCYGNMIKVIDTTMHYSKNQTIQCAITELNKGKPMLTLI